MDNIQYGVIKWYSDKRKYGFITSTDHGDIFFHKSDLRMPKGSKIESGDTVRFELVPNEEGFKARNVLLA